MKNFKSTVAGLALISSALLAGAPVHADVINGNFESGTLSPWTTYTTANGTAGSPTVVSFDTDGDGTASFAAQLRVGQAVFQSGVFAGGGIRQSFTSVSGSLTVSADIAALGGTLDNSSGGRFRLLIDGVVVDEFDFLSITGGAIERATLDYAGAIGAGVHELLILAERPFISDNTPFQYVDDVTLNVVGTNAVPEPGSLALLGLGFAGLAAIRKRKQA